MYNKTNGMKPVAITKSTIISLITVESILKYSLIPPHTPAIILSFVERYNFFIITIIDYNWLLGFIDDFTLQSQQAKSLAASEFG